MKWMPAFAIVFGTSLCAQSPMASWGSLKFLEGTWQANSPASASGPAVTGAYSFRKELDGHILARHGSSDTCKGPADFDCDHHDLLYVYQNAAGQPLKAIYFDNEGHVIHYNVSTPAPGKVMFLSEASTPGPQFRLIYELKGSVMSGKFQMQMPRKSEWKSYLEWNGAKQ